MKIVILQPPYPPEASTASASVCQSWMTAAIEAIDPDDCDLLLLPEYANAPGLEDRELMEAFIGADGSAFLQRLTEASGRLDCLAAAGIVFRQGARRLNGVVLMEGGRRLDTIPEKIHLTDAESDRLGLDPGGRLEVVDWEGLRLGFAPCFDLYFPEVFIALARAGVDLILSPSYQRSESAARIRLQAGCRAMDTGAWLIRSSYAMADGARGGESLVAAPDGSILASAGAVAGVLRFELDPAKKWTRPRSHGQPVVEHRSLLELHRRPGPLRAAGERGGSARDAAMPRLCAHRGLSQACPENTLPAFAAALALGVHEIEFDLWLSRDGVPVVCHDPRVDRTTDGRGIVSELDWPDLRRMDAGVRLGEIWRGVRIPRFEEIIELVGHRAIMNIHLKEAGPDGRLVRLVCDLIRRHGLVDHAYIAGHSEDVLAGALAYDPAIERATLVGQDQPDSQQATAERFACRRIQFPRSVTPGQCRRAREAGLVCNLFFADTAEEARRFLEIGIDVILTNRANLLFEGGVAEPLPMAMKAIR